MPRSIGFTPVSEQSHTVEVLEPLAIFWMSVCDASGFVLMINCQMDCRYPKNS